MKGGRRGRGRGRGKRKKTKIQDGSKLSVKRERMNGKDMGWSGIRTERDGMETEADQSGTETVSGMEAWQDMGLPLPIIQALKELGFTAPTEIQRHAIPIAMDTTRDVIGAAETVSHQVDCPRGVLATDVYIVKLHSFTTCICSKPSALIL